MDDKSARAHSLELASRHGLPPDGTLAAARKYHSFITGSEQPISARERRAAKAKAIGQQLAKDMAPRLRSRKNP